MSKLTPEQALEAEFYEVAEQAALKVVEDGVDLDEAFADAEVQLGERSEEYGLGGLSRELAVELQEEVKAQVENYRV